MKDHYKQTPLLPYSASCEFYLSLRYFRNQCFTPGDLLNQISLYSFVQCHVLLIAASASQPRSLQKTTLFQWPKDFLADESHRRLEEERPLPGLNFQRTVVQLDRKLREGVGFSTVRWKNPNEQWIISFFQYNSLFRNTGRPILDSAMSSNGEPSNLK